MNSSKGVVALGLGIVCIMVLTACGGGTKPPAPPAQLVIVTNQLPQGAVNTLYQTGVSVTGGVKPYTFSITSGSLPPGLTINDFGLISGTPTVFGNYPFTVQVKDSASTTASANLTLYIEGALVITPAGGALPVGSVGVAYSQQLSVSGGATPYTWSLAKGTLPAGLTLDPSSGLITGSPTADSGPLTFTVQATDSEPIPATGTSTYSITVMNITSTTLPPANANVPYSTTLTASGGSGKLVWCVLESSGGCDSGTGSLPAGMTMSTGGVISGTATKLGQYSFIASVCDSQKPPACVTANLTLVVQFPITTTVLPSGVQGLAYSAQLAASGGTPPYSWNLVGGTLPPGLNLSMGGLISGTPTTPGTSSFTVQATDSQGNTATALLSILVLQAITNAALNGNYVFTFNGYSSGTPVLMAGSFVADGNGNITSGVLDFNNGGGEPGGNTPTPQTIDPTKSAYSIGPNGLGSMTLVTNFPATYVMQVAITANGSGKLIQSDPASPQFYGSGDIKKHFPLGQNDQWPLCGSNVAFGTFGFDNSLTTRYAAAGEFQFVPPIQCVDAEGGVMDINDGGSVSSATLTGAFNQYDAATSRGIAGLTLVPGGRHFYAFYLISSKDRKQNQLVWISTDPVSQPANLTLWSALPQASSAQFGANNWNNLALNGNAVAELSALDAGSKPDVTAGSFVGQGQRTNTCPSNDPASFSFDENQGGTANLNASSSGTYCIEKLTGRVTLAGFTSGPFVSPPVFYMIGANQAFVVGTDTGVTSGYFEPQQTPPPPILGTYIGGTVSPANPSVTDSVTWFYADQYFNINGVQDTSGPGGIGGPNDFIWTYAATNGRAVVNNGANQTAIMYVVSPTKVVLMPILNPDGTVDTAPALSVFTSGGSN